MNVLATVCVLLKVLDVLYQYAELGQTNLIYSDIVHIRSKIVHI